MTPWSGADCACAFADSTPGSARAAAISAADGSRSDGERSVTATTAAADATAAGSALLALVDVLRRLRRERVRVETHRQSREIAFLPRLGRIVGCASSDGRDTRRDDQRDTANATAAAHECGSRARPRARHENLPRPR